MIDNLIRKTLYSILIMLFIHSVYGEMIQPRKLVDTHTAGILSRGQFDFEARIYPPGDTTSASGLILGIDVGITDRLTIGLSYGGEGIVGRGSEVEPHPVPGWLIKYRLFEETILFPGVAFGYDHQGHGGMSDTSRFNYKGNIFKSPGFFISASKNFLIASIIQFGIHGMVNYSLEEIDHVNWPNCIAGIDLGINEELSAVFEYDFGLNIKDGDQKYYAQPSDGYFNAGVRWAFSPSFYIEFDARDIFEHRKDKYDSRLGWGREIKLVHFSEF